MNPATSKPSPHPSEDPTEIPTKKPSPTPSDDPTEMPSMMPTPTPSEDPTEMPSMMPTPTPSEDPTSEPRITTATPTLMPTCYPPNAELLESMGDLLSRGPSEARFPKIGRRAGSILQDAKNKGLCEKIDKKLRNIKNLSKQEYTVDRFNKMQDNYDSIMENL